MEELFCGGGIALGLLALGWLGAWREFRRVRRIKEWGRTWATILDSCVREHGGGDDISYGVYMLYQYTVNGVAHKARKDIKSFFGFSGWATEQLASRYPTGRTDLPIAYNPERPEQHQIADDWNGRLNGVWLGMCGIVIVAGMWLLLMEILLVLPG